MCVYVQQLYDYHWVVYNCLREKKISWANQVSINDRMNTQLEIIELIMTFFSSH